MQKIIVVTGATGSQGGAVVRAILNDTSKEFKPRVITRNASNPKAEEYAQAGAEVVTADLDNPDSLRKAFEGAYGAFCVTPLAEGYTPEKEMAEAKNMAQAAKDTKLQHVVWSTLEDTRKSIPLSDNRMPTLHEKYKVPHFDAKGESDGYFRDLGVPTTFLLTSFFWDNLTNTGMAPRRNQNGQLLFTLPMGKAKMAGIGTEDIGKCVLAILKGNTDYIGKTIGIAGEHLTGQEMADALTKALGEKVNYNEITPEVFRSFGFPMAEDLGNMFQYYQEFADSFCGRRDLDFVRKLNPELQSFDQWLAKNAKRIPLS